MYRLTLYMFLSVCAATSAAHAADTATGQNAFTRAVKEPLSGIVTPVPNTNKLPCYSVIDCRRKGGDLQTVWQLNQSHDFSPKDFPQNCYVAGDNGKYIYSQAACR